MPRKKTNITKELRTPKVRKPRHNKPAKVSPTTRDVVAPVITEETTANVEEVTAAGSADYIYCPPSGFVIGNGKVFVARQNRFFDACMEIPLNTINAKAGNGGISIRAPRIPYDHWKQIVSWHRKVVSLYRAEAHISHLLTRDGQYLHVPFHQTVRRGAMTIQVDYQDPDNAAIMEELEREYGVSTGDFHGTTHNHVVSAAFESGTDKSDEEHKQGVHFTVGKMDQKVIDIHARMRVIMSAVFDPDTGERRLPSTRQYEVITDYGTLIEIPGWDPEMPVAERISLAKWHATHVPDEGHPEEWMGFIDEITGNTYSQQSVYGGYGGSYGGHSGVYGGQQQSHNKPTYQAPKAYGYTVDPENWSRKSLMTRSTSPSAKATVDAEDIAPGGSPELFEEIRNAKMHTVLKVLNCAETEQVGGKEVAGALDTLESVLPAGFWTSSEILDRVKKHSEKNYPTQPKVQALAMSIVNRFADDTVNSLAPALKKVRKFISFTENQYAFTRPWYAPLNATAWKNFLALAAK